MKALTQHVVWKLTSNWSYQIKVQCLPPKCQAAENGNTLVQYKYLIIVPNCSTCVTFHLWLTRRHNVHLASSAVAPSPNWWRTSTLNSSTLFGHSNTLRRHRRGTHATPLCSHMRNHGPENVLLSSVVILSLLLFHISKTVSRGDRLSGDTNKTDPSGEAHKPPGAKHLFKIPLKF